ncbi:hypothetical protein COO91_02675 [Nostoc flagelliforme CCNUN1]|uniref:Uncharacterized protein n=1 Tax=Nostoc flagelliforme CCNUN1 TaxID=2038116 RepID=A0A2K8SN15_9NOSO|nr:hypothetical protein COO91_02675 [Nostoc flagelliforme CCNUN1]
MGHWLLIFSSAPPASPTPLPTILLSSTTKVKHLAKKR